MSAKPKKRKISMEPVLQDFTVTSFSDLNPDVGGPSDSSLFEEIKNYNVENSRITFNATGDINLSSGPYPSDSSLDSFIKPQSSSKTNAITKRPFQKRAKKKLAEESLFDSCLKDSFSNELESKTPIENSLFKKPFQRKPKIKRQSNLFDSLIENLPANTSSEQVRKPFKRNPKIKPQQILFDSDFEDSSTNTSTEKVPRHFQRKSKKKHSTNCFDDILQHESINKPSPIQNFITRRKTRTNQSNKTDLARNNNDTEMFDDLFDAQDNESQNENSLVKSNESVPVRNNNNTKMFDDLFDVQGNESQNEHSLELDPCKNKSNLNDNNTESLILEYNEETDNSTRNKDFSTNEETRQSEIENEGTAQYEKNELIAVLSYQENISKGRDSLNEQENSDNNKVVIELSGQRNILEHKAGEIIEDKYNLSNQQSIENQSAIEPGEGAEESEESLEEDEIEDELTIQFEESEGEIYSTADLSDAEENKTQGEETIKFATEDKETSESIEKEINAASLQQNNFPDCQLVESSKLSLQRNCTIRDQDCDFDNIARFSIGNCSQESDLMTKTYESGKQMVIYTPDGSFKDMPSSTPNINVKRVSFLPKEETHLIVSKEHIVINDSISTKRKSSMRSSKGVNKSSIANKVTNDNSYSVRKRRVSFKVDCHSSRANDSLKKCNIKNNDNEQSKESQSNNYYSNISLESLVYVEPSGSRTPDSESAFIDIHPSRGKSSSSSNTDSISDGKKRTIAEVSISQANVVNSNTSECFGEKTDRSENEEANNWNDQCHTNEESPKNNTFDDNCCEEEDFAENTHNKGEFSKSKSQTSTFSKTQCEKEENVKLKENTEEESTEEEKVSQDEEELEDEENELQNEEDELEAEENESEDEEDKENESENEEDKENESEDEEDVGESDEELVEWESEERKNPCSTTTEQLPLELEAGKNQQELKQLNIEGPTHEEFRVILDNCNTSFEQDEDVISNKSAEFKLPFAKKKLRSSSLFEEKHFQLPTKTQLKDILNKIPLSEFKQRTKHKTSEHCISKEQMVQNQIEEVMKNRKSKPQNMKTFSASSKLKRPKKWVSLRLYNFLENKLKPKHGIRSRVKAEELVLFLVEHVEIINKKKELLKDDVEEMKVELARLDIIKTHWDFWKFINQFFEPHFKEKMFPSLPGPPSAFHFGPRNVMENILIR